MKHVIEAGTDGAAIAAFDAAALPADFDQRAGDDPADLMEMLQAQGCMWSGGTGGDGSHIVHILIDEQSSTLEQSQPAWRGPINLPSGRLWVCGAEYVANQPDKGSAFTPKGGLGRYSMGGHVDLKPGVYDMTGLCHITASAMQEGMVPEFLTQPRLPRTMCSSPPCETHGAWRLRSDDAGR